MPNTKLNRVEDLKKMIQLKEKLKDFLKFKEKLGLDASKITCDKQDITIVLQVAFEGEIIHTLYCITKYKPRIEVDEYDHESRDPNYGKSWQSVIEGHGITLIRINLEAPNCINRLIIK